MANIDVQKKKSNPLLWILLLLLAAAVVGYFIWRNTNNPAGEGTPATDTSTNTTIRTDSTRQ